MPVFENLPVLETACADNMGKARERLAENLIGADTQRAFGVMHVETVVESKEDVDPLSCSIVQEWQEVYPWEKMTIQWNKHGKGRFQCL